MYFNDQSTNRVVMTSSHNVASRDQVLVFCQVGIKYILKMWHFYKQTHRLANFYVPFSALVNHRITSGIICFTSPSDTAISNWRQFLFPSSEGVHETSISASFLAPVRSDSLMTCSISIGHVHSMTREDVQCGQARQPVSKGRLSCTVPGVAVEGAGPCFPHRERSELVDSEECFQMT